MSVKYFKDGKWQIFPGTVGAPGKSAYLYARDAGYTGTQEDFANDLKKATEIGSGGDVKELEDKLNNLTSFVYGQHTSVSCSVSPSVFERGNSSIRRVNITTGAKLGNNIVTNEDYSNAVLKKDNTVLKNFTLGTTYPDTANLEGNTTYTLEVTFKGDVVRTVSSSVREVDAIYFGFSENETLSNSIISSFDALNNRKVQSSAAGTYNFGELTGNNSYLWICVPITLNNGSLGDTYTVNPNGTTVDTNFTLSDTTVMFSKYEATIPSIEYKCYRSVLASAGNSFTIKVV